MSVVPIFLNVDQRKTTLGPYRFSLCVNLVFVTECHFASDTLASLSSRTKTNASVAPHGDYD